MKVLITTDWYAPAVNGVVTSVLNLEKELRAMGCEVKVVTLSEEPKSSRDKDVYYLKSINVGKIYPHARAIIHMNKRYLDEIIAWGPDVIHSQCEFSTFLVARRIAKEAQVPIVHTYHTVYEDYTHYFSPNQVWGRKAVACFSRLILHQVDYVIVPTEKVGRILDRYGVTTPSAVIPSGINVRQFDSPEREAAGIEIRKAYGIGDGQRVLVFVGRMAKEKNVGELLEYFDRLDDPRLEFLLVGDGPHRTELEAQAQTLKNRGRIHFTGMAPQNRVSDYYHAGDVFVCASRSETQGITYIEALASGRPVVCRKDLCVDGIVVDGVNGYQYGDFERFRESLGSVLSEERYEKLADRARQTGRRHSNQVFAGQVMEVYRRSMIVSIKSA